MTQPLLQTDHPDDKIHRQQIAGAVNEILKGRQNNTGTLTLAASTVNTTVIDPRIKITYKVFLTPRSSNAAAALPTTFLTSGAVSDGSFVLTHVSTTTADRAFDYLLQD